MSNAVIDNMKMAADWFESCGLPEGLAAAGQYYGGLAYQQQQQHQSQSLQTLELAKEFQRRAVSLGFGTPIRVHARKMTGYGGASGVDINLPWPPNSDRQRPPAW